LYTVNSALSIYNLYKTYSNEFQAIKGINLDVAEGDFFGLLGPNGAGKSTTIGIICSLVNKTAGKIFVFGKDLDTELESVKSLIGFVPQEHNFNQFEPVIEIVLNQAGYHGIEKSLAYERTKKYLKQLGLWEKRRSKARELSGGMKRRLMIARALVNEPKLLILDEPTAGVDIEVRRSTWDFLRNVNALGTTIILTTHYLEEAENLCRSIAIIDDGRIIENTKTKTLLNQLLIETFVLNLKFNLPPSLPECYAYKIRKIDETTLEVDVPKEQGLNGLFEYLSGIGIEVLSLRNKANRLEELFINLIEKKN